jgi:putative hydrolase of the HAD superfamily
VSPTIAQLLLRRRLMVITKDDLPDRDKKLQRSGLGLLSHRTEFVSEKRRESYARLLAQHSIAPRGFIMVGNSLRSDILPILEFGGGTAYIAYEVPWQHDTAEPPIGQPGLHPLEHVGQLPALWGELER